jgi:hypothetical protein
MDILFMNRAKLLKMADTSNTSNEVRDTPTISSNSSLPSKPPRPKGIIWKVLIDQCVNAAIVGATGGLAAFIAAGPEAGWKTAGISFLVIFFGELRKYRNI